MDKLRTSSATLRQVRRLTLRQLVYFTELERHGGFGRAAEALAISQPTLSQQIALLEQTLGVTLVDRSARPLRLTLEGGVLLARAHRVLGILGEAVELLDGRVGTGRLRIGIPNYMSYPVVTDILLACRAASEEVWPFLVEMSAEEISEKLNGGEIDTGFMSLPTPARLAADMKSVTVWQSPYLVCLPKRHALAGKPVLRAQDMAQLDIVLAPRDYHRTHYDYQLASLLSLGIKPRLVHAEVSTAQAQIALTAAGVGACLLSPGTVALPDNVVLKPTEPALCDHTLALFWSPDNHSPALREFKRTARRLALSYRAKQPS